MKCAMWALAALLLLPVSAIRVQGQVPVTDTGVSAPPGEKEKLFTLDLRGSPIRSALMQLFSSSGQDYTLDDRVTGTVTLRIRDKKFEEALKLMLTASTFH
ncbi:MAG: hypothetical protein QM758_09015 [Armatimonas sp.]